MHSRLFRKIPAREWLPTILFLVLASAGVSTVRGEFEEQQLHCGKAQAWLAAAIDAPDYLKYAPSREIQILHLAIDVTPDFKARTVSGSVTVRFKPIAKPFAELKLDGIDLSVSAVESSEKLLGWQATASQVIVTFAEPLPPEREASVKVTYSASPKNGLYFRTPELGYKAEDAHLWTQGEPLEARHWFPSVDAPNTKFTSEVTCRVPEGMTVLSNGRKVSETKDSSTGLVVVRWLQEKPHANYLIALCAGYLQKVDDTYRDIPLAFYTPASQVAQAATSFEDTKDMMAFFEQEIGVAYPWAKYYQACVDDFGWGGMENTTLTILNDNTLFTPETENLRNSVGLVAHELAHQWFGDLVTCKDWSHLWLNEGFATYYEALYQRRKFGNDMFLYEMYQNAQGVLGQANDTNAIVRRDFGAPDEQFGFHAYPKGSWILHMLRHQLGDDLYRRCIKTYLERHQYGSVVTEDLNRVIEELSGRSFDQFFNQYVYHAHHPELNISYSWEERTKLAKLSVQQVQKLSDDVLLFKVPLPVRFRTKTGLVERTLEIKAKAEDFYVPLPEAPELVRIDPELTVLAKISFTPPGAMLDRQLTETNDVMGRLLAAEQMSGRKEAIAKLKHALNHDSFHGVRLAAVRSLRAISTDESTAALQDSLKQSDARVRRDIVSALTAPYRESSYEAARKILQEEKNPDIQAIALGALGPYQKPDVSEILLRFLKSTSYRNHLADTAIGAMRAQDQASYIAPLMEVLKEKEAAFETSSYGRGLTTLGWLARQEDKKDVVRDFLMARLDHPKKRVQQAAINALGTLGDTKALAALERIASGPKENPERGAAERAATNLREGRKPSVEVSTLRGEIVNLQKDNRELRRELDDLKKKLEALVPKTEGKAAKTPAPSGKGKKQGDQ
jgi:aminopeptidase N